MPILTHNTDVYDVIFIVHRKCTYFVMSRTSISNPLYVVSIIYGYNDMLSDRIAI